MDKIFSCEHLCKNSKLRKIVIRNYSKSELLLSGKVVASMMLHNSADVGIKLVVFIP
jgi:hypothetical protein